MLVCFPRRLAVALLAVVGCCLGQNPSLGQPPAEQQSVLRFTSVGSVRHAAASRADLPPFEALTLEAWLYLERHEQAGPIVSRGESFEGAGHFRFMLDYDTGQHLLFEVSKPPAGDALRSLDPLPLRSWVHIAATVEGKTVQLFIDGVLQERAERVYGVGHVVTPHWQLGGGGFTGTLAQVRLWDRALSLQQLQAQATSLIAADSPGLRAWWPLDDGYGELARDLVSPSGRLQLGAVEGYDEGDPDWMPRTLLEGGPYYRRVDYEGPPGSAGGWAIDLDGDDDPDYVRFSWVPPDEVTASPPFWAGPPPQPMVGYRNVAGTLFEDSATVFEPDVLQFVRSNNHADTFDANGDGLDDILIADSGGDPVPPPCYQGNCFPGAQSRLLIQNSDGELVDRTETHMPQGLMFAHGTCVADIDADGDIDGFMAVPVDHSNTCNFEGPPYQGVAPCNHLLINDGAGHFSQDVSRLPLAIVQNGFTTAGQPWLYQTLRCVFLDAESDGDQDLFLLTATVWGTDGGPRGDTLLLNDGTGRFDYAPPGVQPAVLGDTRSLNFAVVEDFDQDGRDDLLRREGYDCRALGDCSASLLYLAQAQSDGTMKTLAEAVAPGDREEAPDWIAAGDLNGDGLPDVVGVGGFRRTFLLLNRDGESFRIPRGVADFDWSDEAVQIVDIDLDGDQDLILDPTGPRFTVFENVRQIPTHFEVAPPGPCIPSRGQVCMQSDRFEVRTLAWDLATPRRQYEAEFGPSLGGTSFLASFFDRDNKEQLGKILYGCPLNGHYWVFLASTTNVEFTTTIRDSRSGEERRYHNPSGHRAPVLVDLEAFPCDVAVGARVGVLTEVELEDDGSDFEVSEEIRGTTACAPGETTACLAAGRFEVTTLAFDHGSPRVERAARFGFDLGDTSFVASFFEEDNKEQLGKVLGACGINGYFWFFMASTTDVEFTTTVRDTQTGRTRTYHNRDSQLAPALTDTRAFACN